jgi:hypothetical protein
MSRRSPLRRRFVAIYAFVIAAIAASFLIQMLHGICPVP